MVPRQGPNKTAWPEVPTDRSLLPSCGMGCRDYIVIDVGSMSLQVGRPAHVHAVRHAAQGHHTNRKRPLLTASREML